MYFLSALDPNYRIKGSRDPLGFQILWAAAGHKAVKDLSTVSSNLRDFMIICYGIHLYGDRNPKGLIGFFLKFEQICGYARRIFNNETGFNGIDYINNRVTENEFYISLDDNILSNQRAYGIYGKYIRPLRDIRITKDLNFQAIMENALLKTDRFAVLKLINPLFEKPNDRLRITKNDLIPISDMLKTINDDEKQLYKEYILKVNGIDHPQNNLYEVIFHNQQISNVTFQLHQVIQSLLSTDEINESLKFALTNIVNTDRVLHPLNRIFTHLLSKSLWTNDDINNDPLFQKLPGKVDYDFIDESMRKLNDILGLPINDMVREIVNRNREISNSRGNKAWIEEDKNMFRVLYGENGQTITEINTETGFEFPYFLNNYIGLFKQIEMA